MVAEALARLLRALKLRGVHGADCIYSANRGRYKISLGRSVRFLQSSIHTRNIQDADEIKKVMSIRRRAHTTLGDFRKGDINVLVSTSVVEEGLDVPSCNLVIKFDFPTSYRSYIQSKGRARKAGSQYLLMVEEGDVTKLASYMDYMKVYKMSMEECHFLGKDPMDEDDKGEEEYFSTKSATVSGTQAQAMINQYLQKIPVDKFTRLTAVWSFSKRDFVMSNKAILLEGLGFSRCAGPQYVATAVLPHKTPLHEPVEGCLRPSKKKARASAALKVVELLHACGELDDRLKPTRCKKALAHALEEEEERDPVSGKKTGTGLGRRRWHAQTPPAQFLAGLEEEPQYLHRLALNLEEAHPNPRYRLHQPERDSHSLGILSATRLPDMGPITLFTASGRITGKVTFLGCLPLLTKKELMLAEEFHRYIVTTVISPGPGLRWQGGQPLIVPVLREATVPDFDLCRRVMR